MAEPREHVLNQSTRLNTQKHTAKERIGGLGGFEDDSKFAGPWRREGPLPDIRDSRDPPRRRFDGEKQPLTPGVSDANDWRSTSRPLAPPRTSSGDSDGRIQKRSGFGGGDPNSGANGDTWTIGSRFKPSEDTPPPSGGGSRFGNRPPPPSDDGGGWRKSQPISSRGSTSPNQSTPPTPARRKLELTPRSTSTSTVVSPLSSPNPANTSRPNPFGAAKLVSHRMLTPKVIDVRFPGPWMSPPERLRLPSG